MKKSFYKDYSKSSDIIKDESSLLKQDLESVERNKKFIIWVQEFSKKIVIATFSLYLIGTIFSFILIYLTYQQGSASGVDTLISELNNTFREIVGGYIIKSAIENAVKIGGNYFIGVSDAKLKLLKAQILAEHPELNTDTLEPSMNNNDYESD